MTKESWEEVWDLWAIGVRTVTAFAVSVAIVFGACCGLWLAGKVFPKSVKAQIVEVAK